MTEDRHKDTGGTPETRRPAGRERRAEERRKTASRGYAYISMVGWMDRREKKRRTGDSFIYQPVPGGEGSAEKGRHSPA